MMKYFSLDASSSGSLTFEELISLILSIYFVEIVFKRRGTSASKLSELKLSFEDFSSIFTEHCFFIKLKPSQEDLRYIFDELDTDHDGFITFKQYSDFVRKYLGNGLDLSSSKYKCELDGVSAEEYAFVQAIWDELKVYFDKYDVGLKGHLAENELKNFLVEVLQETTERELNYVFWNLFRVDSDSNKEVDFNEFASFILSHAGEISLQRFHRQQPKGKVSLDGAEFYLCLSNAYSFLSTMPKEKDTVATIFNRVRGEQPLVSYAGFLNWIHHALAAKYKKQ
uniref:Predicted protein n=2 Tax=Mesangiospermae TaxID=1437183 RepID=F2DSZ5_HORVV|nr:predicted protein [Hordeum vulgare subsp. vulgare]